MTAPRLDSRPARRLTSRECANVLGGLIVSAWAGPAPMLDKELVRQIVRDMAGNDFFWEMVRKGKDDPLVREGNEQIVDMLLTDDEGRRRDDHPFERAFCRFLGSLLFALARMAGESTCRRALRWWGGKDEAWRDGTWEG